MSLKNWKVLIPLITVASAVLGVAIAATNSVINYYRDQPRLYVSITANPPEYRYGISGDWSTDLNTVPFEELVDSIFSSFASSIFEKEKLLIPGATKFLNKRREKIEKTIDSLQARIPIRITISNNGRQPVTIVNGKILVHGYKNNKPVSQQIDNVREFIAPSSVVDLKIYSIEFDKRRSLPDIIIFKLMMDAMSKKMKSWNSSDKEWEHQVLKMIKGMSQIMDVPDWEEKPLRVEVELTDQFGTIIRNSTVLREKVTSSSKND